MSTKELRRYSTTVYEQLYNQKFANGTKGIPDLTNISDLRILRTRSYDMQGMVNVESDPTKTCSGLVFLYFDACSPREVLAEYCRVVHPDDANDVYLVKAMPMTEDPLDAFEIRKHLNRLNHLIKVSKQRKKDEKVAGEVSGKCSQGDVGAQQDKENATEQNYGSEELPQVHVDMSKGTVWTDAKEARALQELTQEAKPASRLPKAGGSNRATVDLEAILPGLSLQTGGAIQHHEKEDSWNMVEITEKGINVVGEADTLEYVGHDWDLCQ